MCCGWLVITQKFSFIIIWYWLLRIWIRDPTNSRNPFFPLHLLIRAFRVSSKFWGLFLMSNSSVLQNVSNRAQYVNKMSWYQQAVLESGTERPEDIPPVVPAVKQDQCRLLAFKAASQQLTPGKSHDCCEILLLADVPECIRNDYVPCSVADPDPIRIKVNSRIRIRIRVKIECRNLWRLITMEPWSICWQMLQNRFTKVRIRFRIR